MENIDNLREYAKINTRTNKRSQRDREKMNILTHFLTAVFVLFFFYLFHALTLAFIFCVVIAYFFLFFLVATVTAGPEMEEKKYTVPILH